MKQVIVIVLIFIVRMCSAQVITDKLVGVEIKKRYSLLDTVPKIVYLEDSNLLKGIQMYVNGVAISDNALMRLDPTKIGSFSIKKGESVPSNIDREIHINLKKDYHPSFVTLDAFTQRLSIGSNHYLFMLNGKVIKGDYSKYTIDEKYVLKAEVDHIVLPAQNLDLYSINLVTRTEKNVDKANTILLRGL